MKHQLLTLIAALAAMASLTSTPAAAQSAMNMSGLIRQQMVYKAQGDAAARAAAIQYYNMMVRLRQQGYTGPSLPTGVTAESLQAANQQLQATMDRYHAASANNANRQSNAVKVWDYTAIRGCHVVVNTNTNKTLVCP